MQTGDLDPAGQLQNTIYARKGSKGGGHRKGLGKGKPGKGAASPAAAAKGGGHTFDGACRHCGMWGHRMSECRRLTAELAKKGGAKGKAGGKGGPKGGKGPIKDPLLEVTADDDWPGDWAGEIGADAAAADLAEWDFATAMCSVKAAAWPTPAAAEVKKTDKMPLPWLRLPLSLIPTSQPTRPY